MLKSKNRFFWKNRKNGKTMKIGVLFCIATLLLGNPLVAQDKPDSPMVQKERGPKGRMENRKGMSRHLFPQIPMMAQQELLFHIDENHDGLIDEQEFERARQIISQRIAKAMEEYRQYYHAMMLKHFDKNANGKLDSEEREHIQRVFEEIHRNHKAGALRHSPKNQMQAQPTQEELNRVLDKCKTDMNSLSRKERWMLMQALRQSDRGNGFQRGKAEKQEKMTENHQKGKQE